MHSIVQLDEIIAGLGRDERARFDRIFQVGVTYGEIVPPEEMKPWIVKQFGALEPTLAQKIVRITNNVTLDGVLFNWLRSSRPMWRAPVDLDAELERMGAADPLANPLTGTPADTFGRVEGRYCVTASNIAKFDGFHGLVVFNERHPLKFTRGQVHDYVDTAWRWAEKAHQATPEAMYYLFIWNCLWRAGASLLHGHAQMMLGRDMHYADVEKLRRAALLYQAASRHNYFEDLFRAHSSIGAGFERPDGVRVLANLTPIKENEVLLLAPHATRMTTPLKDALYDALACYRDRLGATSFNVAIYQPPIAQTEETWEGFPVVVRIVDRGDPSSRTADFGAMELYAASVVSSDPFKLAAALEETIGAE
ncbi:MAG: hypothetical protein HYX51_01865 [Chloroflexi bacterium]|nr:hypothetical protein [Chloroflexota bacterium]